MEIRKPKKLIVTIIIVFVLFISSTLAALFLLGEGAYGGVFRPAEISFSVVFDDGGEEVYKEDRILQILGEEMVVSLKNNEMSPLTFTFVYPDGTLVKETLSFGEEKTLSLKGEGTPSLVLLGEKTTLCYVSDTESLLFAAALMEKGGDLIFPNQTILEGVMLEAPFRLFGNFSVKEMDMDTRLSGDIVFFPNEKSSGKVRISGEACKVYFRNFSLSTPENSQNYYVKAKSLNGKTLDASAFPVSDFEELSRLANEEQIPRFTENGTITFTQSFSLSDSVKLSGHGTLIFQNSLSFEGNTIHFSSDTQGEYRVKTLLGTSPSASDLTFSSPASTLIWENELVGAVPALSTVEKYYNISAYNGAPTALGGEGKALPTMTLSAAENPFLEEDVTFTPQGNTLAGSLPYLVSKSDLEGAVFSLSCQGGEARLEGVLPSGKIVTIDENGKTRSFALEVLREKENIPVLYLETENGAEITSKSQYVSATFALDGENTETPSLSETHIRIRGRGNSTWKWEKKPYKIHFDEPTSLLGLPAAEEWALFANYADKSLIRNRLAQVMASKLSFDYCPTQVCVDVFLNGEYIGIYTLGEHLEEGVGRVEVTHDMTQMDCGYFMEAGGVVSGVDVKGMNYFHAGLVKFVLIKGPDYNGLTSEQFDYIKKYMQEADKAVKSGAGYEEYLDMETLVDWFLMIELSNNTDCAWRRSTYFTKNPGEKLKMGPVWDFDLGFGNFSKDVAGFDVWVSSSEDDYVGETWSTHLLRDPEFQSLVKARWNQVRDVLLETAMAEIDASYELLSPSAEYNFTRWDILGKKVAFERHDTKYYDTFRSQMTYLKDFLLDRAAWMDEQIEAW